ncbi:MAG: translation initiation factor IF-3 [Ignavibacteria bacterium]|nr:translation initiation factor IF-3 [Ignavibacteria bacterium]
MKEKQKRERVNEEITAHLIRVVDEEGKPLGIMPPAEALKIAESMDLDLVEIAPNAKPPVCKIIDFGKYNYEKQKKEKLAKKHQQVMQVKEIRFNANTDEHDVEFKVKHLKQFLMDGHKVKASVIYKGRMITHPEIGESLMKNIIKSLSEVGKLETPPKMDGKALVAYLVPDRQKITALKNKKENQQTQDKQ